MPDGDVGAGRAEGYDAIMVFGGAMHPDQDAEHPWLADEAVFLREAIDREVPLLGVCLGAQLIARAAGASVGPARQRRGRLAHRRAQRGRPRRSGARRHAGPVRRVPVALLRLRAARGRGAPRRERCRPPGLPARRAHVGRAVPSRGDAAHARPLVRRGRVGAAGSGRGAPGDGRSISEPGTSAAAGSATRSSTPLPPAEAAPTRPAGRGSTTTRATSRRSSARRSPPPRGSARPSPSDCRSGSRR